MKENYYELDYWYGYGFRTYTDTLFAKNKKEAIKKIMLRIAKNWPFCFGGGFQLFGIKRKTKKLAYKIGKVKVYNIKFKELKEEDKFVNEYMHYLWKVIEEGKINTEQ